MTKKKSKAKKVAPKVQQSVEPTKDKFVVWDGIKTPRLLVWEQIKSLETNLSKGGGVRDKNSAYYKLQKDKADRGRVLLGAEYIEERMAIDSERKKEMKKYSNKKKLIAENPHLAIPAPTKEKKEKAPKAAAAKTSKPKKTKGDPEKVLAYQKRVIELYDKKKKGPYESIELAAKEFDQEISAGMRNYPHSFISNYRKKIAA